MLIMRRNYFLVIFMIYMYFDLEQYMVTHVVPHVISLLVYERIYD